MTRLSRITGREAVNALNKAGFVEVRMRGSHCFLYCKRRDRIATVPVHSGKILAPKTLKSILRQADMSVTQFRKFL